MNELRKDRRAPASLKVKYKSATVDEFVEQFGADVSRGGIFIKTKKPLDTGALLKFEFQLQGGVAIIGGVGRVAWRRPEDKARPDLPAGMGIKFIKLDDSSRGVVERIEARHGIGSRFDQTENAELAAPLSSMPPSPSADLPAAPPPVRFTTAPPSTAVTHDQPTFRPPPPALSSFPPALGDAWSPNGKPPSAPAPRGALGAFPSTPARKTGRSVRTPARDTSEFLASAFSVGGVGAEVRSQARVQVERARRDPESVDLANELFGDLSEPTQHTVPPAAAAVAAPASGLEELGNRIDSKPASALERSLSDRIPSLDDLVNEPTSAGIPPSSHRPTPMAPPLSAAGAARSKPAPAPANDAKPLSLALSTPPAGGMAAATASSGSSSAMKLVLWGLGLLVIAAAAFVFVRNSQPVPAIAVEALPPPPSAADPSAPATPDPAAAPPPSAAPVALQVRVMSEPRTAELSVDDKPVGATPALVPMVVGTPVTLTFRSPGYATKVEQVTPKPGDSALTFTLAPLQYSLVIDSTPPGALVRANGLSAATPKPLALGHIEGMVTVSIEKEGYQRMSRVVRLDEFQEQAGAMEAELSVSLVPLPAAAPLRRRGSLVREPPPVPSSEPPSPSAPPVMQIKPEGNAAEAPAPSAPAAAPPAAPVAAPEPPAASPPSDPPVPAAQ
jgi:uncharacterized protein (TIGR02266 family)